MALEEEEEQRQSLLASGSHEQPDDDDNYDDDDRGRHAAAGSFSHSPSMSPPLSRASDHSHSTSPRPRSMRQSSLAHIRTNGNPRTPNRVRFDLSDQLNGHAGNPEWVDEEDYTDTAASLSGAGGRGRGNSDVQRIPLLTDIEAPSITLATSDLDFDAEELLESARPKSGMRSAFMNMANSIIGAGIIGQPYAFRQAGLLTGIFLLVALTVTVDWTIQLIVINSKLSGANSFQGTVQHCFGRPGLIAISIAQWAFAFGGMVAFCIIVGDTIPHVVIAIFPSLPDTSFLWLLTDRRAVIVIFILGVSYPLSLYRDIAKVSNFSAGMDCR